jgi:hypothetical protein
VAVNRSDFEAADVLGLKTQSPLDLRWRLRVEPALIIRFRRTDPNPAHHEASRTVASTGQQRVTRSLPAYFAPAGFFASFAQESFSVTVRLKTTRSDVLSLSRTK